MESNHEPAFRSIEQYLAYVSSLSLGRIVPPLDFSYFSKPRNMLSRGKLSQPVQRVVLLHLSDMQVLYIVDLAARTCTCGGLKKTTFHVSKQSH